MKNLTELATRFLREEDGAAAAEYAILVALIAAAVALAVKEFELVGIYDSVNTKVKTAAGIS